MNWIDGALVVLVLLAIWSGWQKGFIVGMLELFSWLTSLALGFLAYPFVAGFFHQNFPTLGFWIQPLSFLLAVIVIRSLISIPVNLITRRTSPEVHHHKANHFLGMIPGVINGVIYATLIAALLFSVPFSDTVSENAETSVVASRLRTQAEWANQKLYPIFSEAVERSMKRTNPATSSGESVELHFTVKKVRVRQDLEVKMLEMVNQERAKVGLKPLQADPELAVVARAHSTDMFARGYFAHNTPDGKDPFDRMREYNVKFLSAGENLALGQTLTICHKGLMNSPGHRANILHPSFGRLGIGIVDGGIYGLMISQEFRN